MSSLVECIFFILGVCLLFLIATERWHKIIQRTFRISNKPLFTVKLFWVATVFPLLIALILSIPVFISTHFDFSPAGYAKFVELFSFPLWVASGSIVLGVLVGRFHGSVQRHAAFIQTESSNNFKNYFEHKNMFMERINHNGLRYQGVSYSLSFENEGEEERYRIGTVVVGLHFQIDLDALYNYFYPENSYVKFDLHKHNFYADILSDEENEDLATMDMAALNSFAQSKVKKLNEISGIKLTTPLTVSQFMSKEVTNYSFDWAYTELANLQCFACFLEEIDRLITPISLPAKSSSNNKAAKLFNFEPFHPLSVKYKVTGHDRIMATG